MLGCNLFFLKKSYLIEHSVPYDIHIAMMLLYKCPLLSPFT